MRDHTWVNYAGEKQPDLPYPRTPIVRLVLGAEKASRDQALPLAVTQPPSAKPSFSSRSRMTRVPPSWSGKRTTP